jgi:hypothetical protein
MGCWCLFVGHVFLWQQQYVRLTVGAVKTESKIIKNELNPEWNQIFAVGKDKIQGGTLELSVWDAVSNTTLSFSLSTKLLSCCIHCPMHSQEDIYKSSIESSQVH